MFLTSSITDSDKNGFVDEDEFIAGNIFSNIDFSKLCFCLFLGCMLDEVFVDILENFDADKLWGKFGL